MDAFLKAVEYDALLEGLAASCRTEAGKERLRAFLPAPEEGERALRLERTRLLETHMHRHGAPPSPDPGAPGKALEAAAENGETFDGRECALLAAFLDGVVEVRRYLSQDTGGADAFADWKVRLDPFPALREELRRCVSVNGEILDDASAALKTARQDLRRVRGDLDRLYQTILLKAGNDGLLQEKTVTERNARWVVPVKRESRSSLPGIVHGLSASGSTAFVEPGEAVPLNNAWSEALGREEEEVRAVLRALTLKTLGSAPGLRVTFEACAELDAHQAVARFATRFACAFLSPEDSGGLFLKEARHPLLCLEAGEAYRDRVVPLDLEAGPTVRGVLVSGPNAGGKTVALKTVGLVCALVSAGMPVPAASVSRVPGFRFFDTDLGDGQSLADHLSTYEARLRALRRMLEEAGPRVLLLLDELGAGTDPQEGGALALACLEEIRARGAFVFATTHQPLLKLFMQEEKDMMNAAMLMDEATGLPTYRFAAGFPGRSYAMELAAKVGLPGTVLSKARGFLPQGEADLVEVLSRLEGERRDLERARLEAERTRDSVKRTEAELLEAKRQIKDEARRIRREAQTEAEGLLKNTRRKMEHILQGVGADEKRDLENIRKGRREVEVKLANLRSRREPVPSSPEVVEVKPGDEVLFKPGGIRARVLEADEDKRQAVLQSGGGPRFTCRFSDLARAEGRPEPFSGGSTRPLPREEGEAVPLQVDIRGFRVEEGVAAVEKFLDRALMAGYPFVRILHGKGTGKLKEGVLASLKAYPAVAGFRDAVHDQGGAGVTVVDFKKD